MPDLYIINIKPRHWEICRKDTIFGIPRGAPTLFRAEGRWKKGDICLVRGTAPNYGIRAIWYIESEKRIKSKAENPWKDFDCEWLVQLKPLVEFKTRLSEEFETKSKYSRKVEMFASRFYRSVLMPTPRQAGNYARALAAEKKDELAVEAWYMGKKVRVGSLLNNVVAKAETLLVLEQHSPGLSEYDDQIGAQYHYPQQYFSRIVEGSRFIYCRPKKGERGQKITAYFGTGTIGAIRKDTTREGHRYCQIENYFEFPKEVAYVDKHGTYLETGTRRQPVMRSAVREISTEGFERIVKQSELENDADVAALLKTSDDTARLKELDEAYQNATPQKKHVITTRIERDTAIGGKVKELNEYVCQICGSLPFLQRTGRLYAEAHHVTPLHVRESGSLASQNVICVCANCHRKMHYGNVRITDATEEKVVFEIDERQVVIKRNRI